MPTRRPPRATTTKPTNPTGPTAMPSAAPATPVRASAPLLTSPITGETCCAEHAPGRKTDSWWRDRWRRVTPRDRTEWPTAELGEMRCEVCKAIERRASDAAAAAAAAAAADADADADASRTAGA